MPDVVSREELSSAITLGGVQINLSGIVGPVLGGLLLPLLHPPLLISFNALAFAAVALAILPLKPRQIESTGLRENFCRIVDRCAATVTFVTRSVSR